MDNGPSPPWPRERWARKPPRSIDQRRASYHEDLVEVRAVAELHSKDTTASLMDGSFAVSRGKRHAKGAGQWTQAFSHRVEQLAGALLIR